LDESRSEKRRRAAVAAVAVALAAEARRWGLSVALPAFRPVAAGDNPWRLAGRLRQLRPPRWDKRR
jgi:hypothetical protein